MELSRRLQAVADLVTAGYKTADIGTDHAYIPIQLVREGRIPEAVAMDVNRGPLERARLNVRENGMEDRISLRLSDGFEALKPGEVQSAVAAGMGGSLVIRILREGAEVVRELKECILQPQSEIEKVRAFLLEEGFFFIAEDMVKDDGKYYPMMKVKPPARKESGKEDSEERKKEIWSETELRYGKLLLEQKNPVLKEYLEREIRIKEKILQTLDNKETERILSRRKQLENELRYAEKGMEHYAL